MNEELTREVLGAMTKCSTASCLECPANGRVCVSSRETVEKLATALLEERAKPKVWDGAPEDAVSAVVTWCRSGEIVGSVSYNRELPKTRTREIAENIVHGINGGANGKDIEYVEGVLKRYAEELEGEGMKDAREFTDDDVYEFANEWCEESLQKRFDEFDVDDMKHAYIAGCMKILSHVHEFFMPRSGA